MPKKIIIALNNDKDNGGVGQKNAQKIYERLLYFFNPETLEVRIPEGYKDFGLMSVEKIKEWYGIEPLPLETKREEEDCPWV